MKIIGTKVVPYIKSLLRRSDIDVYVVPFQKNSDSEKNKSISESQNYSSSVDLPFIFSALNNITWILGVVVTLIAIWLKTDFIFWNLINFNTDRFCASDYIGIGSTIFIIGLTGTYIAYDKSTSVFKMFFILMMILIALEVTAVGVLWSAIHSNQFQSKLTTKMKYSIEQPHAEFHNHFISAFQFKYECCGAFGPGDYESLPLSCIDFDTGKTYEEGCVKLAAQYIKTRAYILGGAFISSLILQILSAIISLCLIATLQKRNQQHLYFSETSCGVANHSML